MRALTNLIVNTMPRPIKLDSTPDFYKKESKKLLKQYREKNLLALDIFDRYHPNGTTQADVKLADAQLVIARHYGQKNWVRLLEIVDSNEQFKMLYKAFDERDKNSVEQIVRQNPILFDRLLLRSAVLYNDIRLVKYMYDLGARDIQDALGQCIYSCSGDIADFLISKGGDMEGNDRHGLLGLSACEILRLRALKFTLHYGSKPIPEKTLQEYYAMLVRTYMRNPKGKHECVEELVRHGLKLEDSPIAAFHSGRLDLLKKHIKKDPDLVNRRFSLSEIFSTPYFDDPTDGLHLTPLVGSTLLHMAMEYDERKIMKLLVKKGANVNATSLLDEDGFGNHTPLFHTTVTFITEDDSKAAFLLKNGADPNHRCSIKKQLKHTGKRHMEDVYEYHNVTPISFAKQWLGGQNMANKAVELLKRYGGIE